MAKPTCDCGRKVHNGLDCGVPIPKQREAEGPYCLTQDGNGHWYVIPADKTAEFDKWVQASEAYWENADAPEKDDPGDCPDWADEVGGSYTLVTFPSYQKGGAK